jgi:hypothetical protein
VPTVELLRVTGQKPLEAGEEIFAVGVILKNVAALDPPQDDMVKGTGCIDSGFTGHDGCVSLYPMKINLSPSIFLQ